MATISEMIVPPRKLLINFTGANILGWRNFFAFPNLNQ